LNKKICVVLVDRANYGRMFPVMKAIKNDDVLKLQTLCAGTMLLERFGYAEKIVQADGFSIDGRVFLEIEGSMPVTMSKSIGLGIIEFSSEFQRLAPDIVLLIGDRYEALAASIAAAYMNIPIAHIQGGEVSGSIDESARHAITKFAQLHFPATQRSADYIRRMGEHPKYIFNVGCPSGDYITKLDSNVPAEILSGLGVGRPINLNKPFFLVILHPVTTEYEKNINTVNQLIKGLDQLSHPTIWIWPNIDAGSDLISKSLRAYRENNDSAWLYLIKNIDPVTYQKILKRATCAIGNSSSFIRDSTFSGTPVVLVGNRQFGREHGENLVSCASNSQDIIASIRKQITHGRYNPSRLYGNGKASEQIVDVLKKFEHYTQKKLYYFADDVNINN
jgi:UDP-hydrolysing UDP-N-acetyl-D-glucosamine 2-epimerase